MATGDDKELNEIKIEASTDDDSGGRVDAEYIPSADAGPEPEPDTEKTSKKVDTTKMLTVAYKSIFDSMFPAWEISADEIAVMSDAQGDALDVWYPDGIEWLNGEFVEKVVVTGFAFGVTVEIMKPRIGKPRKEDPDSKEEPDQSKRPADDPYSF
jgi:hypothetical protein